MKSAAKWITSPRDAGAAAYIYRKEFLSKKAIKKASLYATAMGVYALWINGARVGKGVLTPGWTSYAHRVQYQTYDVTDLLTPNTRIELGVGQGWAVGYIGYANTNHYSDDKVSVLAWMDVVYADGSRETLATDESWEVYTSEVTSSEIYHGETVDKTAPIERVGKAVLSDVKTKLVAQVGEWITEQERLAPIEVIRTPKGELVLDFGQNLTGYVEIKIKGNYGDRIVLHHAEVLDKDGNFYTDNLRAARNENIYVLSGGEDVFKPTYSFQGFRYVRLVEYPLESVDVSAFRAIAVNSEMQRTGQFRCGNEKINQLYHNVIWGQKSNYLDIPTDCPQRDERLGWTGDAQVFCRTAAINFDVEKFFRKWLGDMALEQSKDGHVLGVVPNCFHGYSTRISSAWGDAACIIPWQLYLAYGNRKNLKEQFPMMKKWVTYMHSAGPEEFLWLGGRHYGDWLAIDGGEDACEGATSKDFIASAFFAYSTELVIRAGEVLGENVDEYRALYKQVRTAFRAFFMKDGLPASNSIDANSKTLSPLVQKWKMTQTALVLILHFELYEPDEREGLVHALVEMIRENGTRMATGFVGTPYILHVLSQNGYTDLAYELLMQEKSPSWLYSVCHGATTMWEHWNGIKDDGSFWSKSMNSFNHYAYGAVFDWLFGVTCGIQPLAEAPAYKEIVLSPIPNKCLGFADASIASRNGYIRSHWYYKGDTVYYEFEIPEGVTATLRLPSGYTETLTAGSYRFAE
ncbi:MAG: family 78 glycoside hydrolase catalytic domain [Clostridia bacterium]|nr:family 78 glycoside hydrolase catalytic domain [Clostridia bacterium]